MHCKSVGDGRRALKYLGAYLFRVAISEARVVSYDGQEVIFKYRKVGSRRSRKLSLPALEFIRRFLQHVLPKGFVKLRHFGFLSPNFTVPLQKIRQLICVLYELLPASTARPTPPIKPKPLRCPRCRLPMQWIRFMPSRSPPLIIPDTG